ncbi:MAG TPA: hypothetical protein VFV31_06205 [Chitinophagaceae bacterium]|nr:hypothetical protein [Chitinophagaceae bacterium]
MKNNIQASVGLPASLLKAIQPQAPVKQINNYLTPYLRAVLSGNKKPAKVYSLRSIKEMLVSTVKPFNSRVPTDIELSENNWFTNYE